MDKEVDGQEEEDLAQFEVEFTDPMSARMDDLWVHYKKMGHPRNSNLSAMLVRPRLTIQDVRDMVERPEQIQLFQYKDTAACLSGIRRRGVAMRLISTANGIQWRQIGARHVPRAKLR